MNDETDNYNPIFRGGAALGVIAAVLHIPIDDRPLPRTGTGALPLPLHV